MTTSQVTIQYNEHPACHLLQHNSIQILMLRITANHCILCHTITMSTLLLVSRVNTHRWSADLVKLLRCRELKVSQCSLTPLWPSTHIWGSFKIVWLNDGTQAALFCPAELSIHSTLNKIDGCLDVQDDNLEAAMQATWFSRSQTSTAFWPTNYRQKSHSVQGKAFKIQKTNYLAINL